MPGEAAPADDRARCGIAQGLVLRAIRSYQLLLAPMYAGSCRYLPSCSAYASEAVERHGALRGGALALRRLMRCHPFGGHGVDPVPAYAPLELRLELRRARPADGPEPDRGRLEAAPLELRGATSSDPNTD